jgi:RES domain-containing protein
LVYLSATLPDGEPGRAIQPDELPPDWWSDDNAVSGETARELGDAWIRSRSSLAMQVPSVPIRVEWNVVLNPLHPRISELKIETHEPLIFDARMFQPTPV